MMHKTPTNCVWSHGVNSHSSLDACLANDEVTMIETDLCWNTAADTTVMRHAVTSPRPLAEELTFDDFLQRVLQHNATKPFARKGFKLDFKNGRCVQSCAKAVDLACQQLCAAEIPSIWYNADIVAGPNAFQSEPVDPKQFLIDCRGDKERIMPNVTLSVGWTTSFLPVFGEGYTDRHVATMKAIIEDESLVPSDQHITFPVRASFVKSSWNRLLPLLDSAWRPNRPSLTLWTADEGIPTSHVEWIKQQSASIDLSVYFDIDKGSKVEWYNPQRLIDLLCK